MSAPGACDDGVPAQGTAAGAACAVGPVTGPDPRWHVAECLMPGMSRATAEALGRRVRQELAALPGRRVTFLGSLLMPEDEVLLCLFAGPEAEVREVSERAGVPFERILACMGIGCRTAAGGGPE
jgi:hypothetical protein